MRRRFRVIPRGESPLFDSISREVPLTPEERRIAQSLREVKAEFVRPNRFRPADGL